jgi:hypothetical protein
MEIIICKNCELRFRGNYCPNCRQSSEVHRITWHDIGHHFVHALFHVDKGLLYTVNEMLFRPGKTISEYLNGKRAYHFNPFLFLLLLGATASLLFVSVHVRLIAEDIDMEAIERTSPLLAHKHFTIIGGIVLLYLTLTDFILHFKKKYTLPELFVSNSFQIGEILVFLILAFPFLYLQKLINLRLGTDIEIRYFLTVFFYGYLFWVRFQFYEAKKNYAVQVLIIIQLFFLNLIIQYGLTKLMLNIIEIKI